MPACAGALLALAACGSAGNGGTFDNTGGAPPAGSAVSFASVPPVALDAPCSAQIGSAKLALLARTPADIPLIGGDATCSDSLRAAVTPTLAALTSDQALGIFTLALGGCVRSYEVALVNRDGNVMRPWVLRHDTTLGARAAIACTADAIVGVYALRMDGAAGATSLELTIGTINPNYPRAPDVPRF